METKGSTDGDNEVRAEHLRQVAAYVEINALNVLSDYTNVAVQLRSGGAQQFPRASREDELAQQGFAVLRENIEEAVASLYALASVADQSEHKTVPLVLLAPVQAYLRAFSQK